VIQPNWHNEFSDNETVDIMLTILLAVGHIVCKVRKIWEWEAAEKRWADGSRVYCWYVVIA
jgi:hypothetical protein